MQRTALQLFSAIALLSLLALLAGCELMRSPEDCDADLSAMQEAVATTLNSATSCRLDSDCVFFNPSNKCFDACPVAINGLEYQRVEVEVNDAERSYCLGFSEQCGSSGSSMECQELQPSCVQGRCQLIDPLDLP